MPPDSSKSPRDRQETLTNKHREAISSLLAMGDYFSVSRRFVKCDLLDVEQSYVLQDLMNSGAVKCGTQYRWFMYTVEEMWEATHFDRNKQQRVLKSLCDVGYIKVAKSKTVPPRRIVRIEFVAIANSIMRASHPLPNDTDSSGSMNSKSCSLNDIDLSPSIYKKELNTKNVPVSGKRPARSARGDAPAKPGDGTFLRETRSRHEVWAARLHRALCRAHNLTIPCKLATWASAFRLLHQRDCAGDEGRVEQTLAWYEKNTAKWHLDSAAGFRKWFAKLEALATKGKVKVAPSVPEEIDPDAAYTLKRLRNVQWPHGSDEGLPSAVNATFVAYRKYRKRTYARLTAHKSSRNSMWHWLSYLHAHLLIEPVEFTYQWWMSVYEKVHWRDHWDGDLAPFVFAPDCAHFLAQLKKASAKYGDASMVKKFLEEIG